MHLTLYRSLYLGWSSPSLKVWTWLIQCVIRKLCVVFLNIGLEISTFLLFAALRRQRNIFPFIQHTLLLHIYPVSPLLHERFRLKFEMYCCIMQFFRCVYLNQFCIDDNWVYLKTDNHLFLFMIHSFQVSVFVPWTYTRGDFSLRQQVKQCFTKRKK